MAAATPAIDSVDESIPNVGCFNCKTVFEDPKSTIRCTVCGNYFHGKCEDVNLRGFHMRKATWRCKTCAESLGEATKPERSRKRSRVEEGYIDQDTVSFINTTLETLVNNTNVLMEKMDLLIEENRCLKMEIAYLKDLNTQVPRNDDLQLTYSAVAKKSNNVLIVKQKGTQKEIKEVKQDIRQRVDPTDMGVGVTMGRVTKQGGVIINCSGSREIASVQTEIQDKLGGSYDVERPKSLQHRVRIVGIDECEYDRNDSDILVKIVKQNELNINDNCSKMDIIRKTKIIRKKFSIIIELDQNTYNVIIKKGKISIGWSRCPIYDEYGIIRCFNCCKYGHFSRDCTDKKVCPKCSGEHSLGDCQSNFVKCSNCLWSNKKYGMALKVDHTTWDHNQCETLKRFEKIQNDKYNK